MSVFNNPKWIDQFKFSAVDRMQTDDVFREINTGLDRIQKDKPVVSIVVAAFNEEDGILNTIGSLSKQKTNIPLEIVVVNNNSTDGTQQILDRLHVRSCFQPVQGWGPARQMGMEAAKGKYILMADADCFYPGFWVEKMMQQLDKDGVACVYGRYAFLSEPEYPRWKLFLLEKMKNAVAELRHLKRPYLNAYGMSMGFVRDYGLKAGYVMHAIRGEDGRMCFDLMQFGKIRQVKSSAACVWTSPRTLKKDGSFGTVINKRVRKELKRFSSMFYPHPPHDTKTSTND